MFYSSVILKGTETVVEDITAEDLFYSSVILKGTETENYMEYRNLPFYSSVILKGTETNKGLCQYLHYYCHSNAIIRPVYNYLNCRFK